MPMMSDVRSVAANSTVENVLTGKLHEFLNAASVVRLFITGSAAGLFASLLVSGESFLQDQEVSAANRFPLIPDDFTVDAGGFQGDRLVLSLRNSTGAAITARTLVEVRPVG